MASSQTNVAVLYQYYGSMFPAFTGPADPGFLAYVNLGLEQVINSGTWDGCVVWTIFNGSSGAIALPYNMQTIIGVDINGAPQSVFGQFAEYQEVGPGMAFTANRTGCGPLLDYGEWPTQKLIPSFTPLNSTTPASGTLTIGINNVADAGIVVRILGIDANGVEVTDATGARGIAMTTAYPKVTGTQVFSDISNVLIQSPTTIPHLHSTLGSFTSTTTDSIRSVTNFPLRPSPSSTSTRQAHGTSAFLLPANAASSTPRSGPSMTPSFRVTSTHGSSSFRPWTRKPAAPPKGPLAPNCFGRAPSTC